jgi:hypothetical protein
MDGFFPLIIVIVAGLISFLSKMKDQKQEGSGRQKPFLPPNLDPMHPKHFEKRQTKQQTTISKEPKYNSLNERQGQTFTFEETSVKAERKSELKQSGRSIQLEVTDHAKPIHVRNLNKQKIVEGIIMAEVLGAPRSLKPLHSSRYITNKKLSK